MGEKQAWPTGMPGLVYSKHQIKRVLVVLKELRSLAFREERLAVLYIVLATE